MRQHGLKFGLWFEIERAAFPHVYMEGCASGGMRICLSALPCFDSYWRTLTSI